LVPRVEKLARDVDWLHARGLKFAESRLRARMGQALEKFDLLCFADGPPELLEGGSRRLLCDDASLCGVR
jgi:hypothetical protein